MEIDDAGPCVVAALVGTVGTGVLTEANAVSRQISDVQSLIGRADLEILSPRKCAGTLGSLTYVGHDTDDDVGGDSDGNGGGVGVRATLVATAMVMAAAWRWRWRWGDGGGDGDGGGAMAVVTALAALMILTCSETKC